MPISTSSSQPRVTIREVAQEAGVALTTVSAALNGTGRVSARQRDRIQAIAAKRGYQPRLAAQLLRSNSSGYIGLIVPVRHGAPLQQAIMGGHSGPIMCEFIAQCEARELKYHIEFVEMGREDFDPPELLAGGLMDGVLVAGWVDERLREWLQSAGRAWVSVDEVAPLSVLSATEGGFYEAVQHLAALGHRRIGFLGGPLIYETHRQALSGFERAVRDFRIDVGLEGSWIYSMGHMDQGAIMKTGMTWAQRVMGADHRPTAVVCGGLLIANGVLFQAAKMGIETPRDLSLIGQGIATDSVRWEPNISLIEVNFAGMVREALDMLESCLKGKLTEPKTVCVPPTLAMKATVAPPSDF